MTEKGDLISREALIKWIDNSVSQYGNTYSTDMLNMWGLFKDYLINNAPTVERPQGEWIIIKSPLSTETVVKCPFCHDEFIGNDVEHYNFCPICGADMRGKEE